MGTRTQRDSAACSQRRHGAGACDRRCRGDQADHEDHPRSHAADEREEGEEEGREEAEEGQEGEEGQEAEEEKEEEGQEAEEEEKEEEKEEEGSPGKRKKGQHKSKASVAAGKKNAAKQKAAGKGLFKVRTCSAALTAITGKSKMTCPAIVKAVLGYIKSKKLNNKRMINPTARWARSLAARRRC